MEESAICDCGCPCHSDRWDYRLFKGDNIEGYSIRAVGYDKDGKIETIGEPELAPMGTEEEALVSVELVLADMESMRRAFDMPMLDEQQVEKELSHNQ
jgi:hypothetical protein